MKKFMITFTAISDKEILPTMMVNISPKGMTLSYPNDPRIEVEVLPERLQYDLALKFPYSQEEFYFVCVDGKIREICLRDVN